MLINCKKCSFLLLCLLSVLFTFGQEKITLSGIIKDVNSGETLSGALIRVQDANVSGYSNNYGFYSITLPAGEYLVEASYVGYNRNSQSINLTVNRMLDFVLNDYSTTIEGVVVSGERQT